MVPMSEHSPPRCAMLRGNSNTALTPAVDRKKGNTMDKSMVSILSPPPQNVAFAVNYSLPSVDQFVVPGARAPSDRVQPTIDCTRTPSTPAFPVDVKASSSTPTSQPAASSHDHYREGTQLTERDMNRGNNKRVTVVDPPPKRSSRRERKPREKSREKLRVRYDMNHVPMAQRHPDFVAHHRSQADHIYVSQPKQQKRRALPPRRCLTASSSNRAAANANSPESTRKCHKCKGKDLPAPFVADSSVVWIPTKRSEWEDCLSEMTAVCTSAALRRHVASQGKSTSKPFFAPLSQDYIRDRIDIDDPLEGYQIRHKTGGWLQGFIMWTNFTTWTHYFKWDSLHEMSGIQATRATDKSRRVDADGSLAAELEGQPRSGDPLATGVVFPTIAEIGLLGGIGCGEYLLRMALDDIMSRGQYKYVVMQATDSSRTFYERFGFVRVGAVCRYGPQGVVPAASSQPQQGQQAVPGNESGIVGYRHWTYANERNLDTYGGPSYMMALRLPSIDRNDADAAACVQCASEVQKPTIIDQLKAVAVEEKPKITQLGAAATPAKRGSLTPVSKPTFYEEATPAKKTPQSPQQQKPQGGKRPLPLTAAAAPARNRTPMNSSGEPKPKRRRTGTIPVDKHKREELMTPPPAGQTLTYAQKQYHSVWLAVPPKSSSSGGRRPPRVRNPLPDPVPSGKKEERPSQEDSKVVRPDESTSKSAPDVVKSLSSEPKKEKTAPVSSPVLSDPVIKSLL